MLDKVEILEQFITKSASRPEVSRVAIGEAAGLPVPPMDAGMAHGLAVGAKILAQILWPDLTLDELREHVAVIGEQMTRRGML